MTPRRRLLATTLAVIGSALAFAPPPAAAAPRSFTTGFSDPLYADPSVAGPWLQRTTAVGAQVVLIDADWASIAPRRPSGDATNPANPGYVWGDLDEAIRTIVAHGLTPVIAVATAAGGPAWADGPRKPRNAAAGTWRPNATAFGAFAEAIARRYSGTFDPGTGTLPAVHYYQAWSEPNLPNHLTPQWVRQRGHWVAESPIVYRGLLNAFYAGVKAVSRSDRVITGGTAPFGDKPGGQRVPPALFVRQMLCLSRTLKPQHCPNPAHFDILAHHPYALGSPTQHAFNADDVSVPDLGKLTRPLRVAERTGRAVPRGHKRLWVTEFSWDSNPPDPKGVPVMKRAHWIEQAFHIFWQEGVDTIAWYLIADQAPVPSYATTYQSGIYFRNGQPKPGFEAFRFPFVVTPTRGGRAVLWGIAPSSGTVAVQQRQGGRWTTVARFKRSARAIFTGSIRLRGRPQMRAQVGSETSLVWRPS